MNRLVSASETSQLRREFLILAAGLFTLSVFLVTWGPNLYALIVPVLGLLASTLALLAPDDSALLKFSSRCLRQFPIMLLTTVSLGFATAILGLAVLDQSTTLMSALLALFVFLALVLGWFLQRDLNCGRSLKKWIIPLLTIAVVVLLSSEPVIDVLVFERDGAAALLRWENPYSLTFESPFPDNANHVFFGEGLYEGSTLLFGFPYPPPPLLVVVVGSLLGDVRVGAILLHFGASFALYRTASDSPGRKLSILFLVSPGFLLNAVMGWTELVGSSLLALTLCALVVKSKWAPFFLGIFAISKQYIPFFVPLAPLLIPEARRLPGGLWRNIAITATVSAVVLVPFVLWAPKDFIHSVITLQFNQPWRSDAFSLLVWWGETISAVPRWVQALLPLMSAFLVSIFLGAKSPTGPWAFSAAIGVVMCVLALTAKQAFANYFAFATAALLIGAILICENANDDCHPSA